MKKVLMGEMTVNEVREYLKDNQTIILPYGVVEQHGYHLPLDTDIRNCVTFGEKIAKELGCIVAPALNYCFSGGMLPGTINVKPNTFAILIGEIIESLVVQGFREILIVPGHGGSESLLILKESLRILKWVNPALADVQLLLVPFWEYSPTWRESFVQRDYHAGRVETSLLMHWCPEVVEDDQIQTDQEDVAEMLREDPDSYQLRTTFTESTMEIPTTTQRDEIQVGSMGYPEEASAELGEKVTTEIMTNLIPVLREVLDAADSARKSGKRVTVDNGEKLKITSL